MTASDVAARRREATAFLDAARLLAASDDHADWKVAGSNAVLGGIAASDAICGRVLGYCSAAENHAEARRLLDTACGPDRQPGLHLRRLVDEKTSFQYSGTRVTRDRTLSLLTALERLVERMEHLLA